MLQIDVYAFKQADLAANAMFADRDYLEDFNGDELIFGDNLIWEYDGEYFDRECALDFVIHLGAKQYPKEFDGRVVIDYKGAPLSIDVDTYSLTDCHGVQHIFESDEVEEMLQELGAHEVSEDE